MSVLQPPLPELPLSEPPLTDGPRNFRRVRIVLFSVLAVIVVLAGYGVTFAPVHMAQLRAEVNDGTRALPLGDDTRVTPPADWVSEPLVRDLITWPPLPPLKDWSVLIGRDPGWLVHTPDQVLRVELSLLGAGDTQEFMGDGPVQSEVLASGATVTHVTEPDAFRAVVDTGSGLVALRATVSGEATLDTYLPAISQLLEGVGPSSSAD